MFEAKEILPNNYDWIALIFFAILLLLVFVKIEYKERLYHTSMLFFSKKHISIYFNKEKNSVFNWFQFSFFLIQVLGFSLLFYLSFHFFKDSLSPLNFKNYLIFLVGIALYFGIRFIIGSFIAHLFSISAIYKKILFEKLNYFNGLILWILPFLMYLVYTKNYQKTVLISTLILFCLFIVFRYVLILSNNKNLLFNNLFYFILYLCALEIAPLVLIFKLTI